MNKLRTAITSIAMLGTIFSANVAEAGYQLYHMDLFDDGSSVQWYLGTDDNEGVLIADYYSEDGKLLRSSAWSIDNPNPTEDVGISEPNIDAIKDLAKEQGSGEVPVDFWKTQLGKELIKKGKGNPVNPVHNPGLDDTNGGISVDINNHDNFDFRKDLEAYVEEAQDLIGQATRHDPEDREDVERSLAEIMSPEKVHAGLIEQLMPSNDEEDEGSARQDDIALLMEAVAEEDALTGPPEAVNPDPTTRAFGSAVATRSAKFGTARLSSKHVDNATAGSFGSAFGTRAAKLSISKPLPKKIGNPTARTSSTSFDTRAAKPGVAKPAEKQVDNQTARASGTSFDTRAAKPGVARPFTKFATRAMTR
jgi:hypothetical protein